MRKYLAIISCSIVVSGCVTGAVVAGTSSIASSIIYDKRNLNVMRQDALIERNFYNILDQQDSLDNSSISIKSMNHNVLLIGYVANSQQKNLAFNVAKSVKNVHRIYNQIRVGKASSAFDEAKDLWLTGRVKAAILKQKGIHSGQISLVVHDSTLYMLGIVPNPKQAIAADVGRRVQGIKKVVTLFENP